MTARTRITVILSVLGTLSATSVLATTLWLIPKYHALRITIDNDRASAAVIAQQQSNLNQLAQDVASIKEKQQELETYVWSFAQEDTFFSRIESLGKAGQVTIDPPRVADATPTGTILTRATTITIHGTVAKALAAISPIQQLSPLMTINKVSVATDTQPGQVLITLTGTTVWK
jgi:hypothetical protein